jgi:fructose-bisphosphate aldolase, class II
VLLDPIQARAQFADALARGYAILAVNADSPAALTDCLEAARQARAPIIIETSLWQLTGHSFGAGDAVRGLVRYLVQLSALANAEPYREVPVFFHTDHIKGPETLRILGAAIRGECADICGTAVRVFASTISLDSSELSEAQNIEHICALCDLARDAERDLTLEMEAGVDDGLTPPEITRRLLGAVEEKHPGRVWLWAPGCGTRHGFSPEGYPEFSAEHVVAQREIAKQITGRDLGIALHGSSGLSEASLRAAVGAGVVKVNWSSESLHIRSQAARDFYATHTAELEKTHPQWKATAMDAGVQGVISKRYVPRLIERLDVLRSTGKAGRNTFTESS